MPQNIKKTVLVYAGVAFILLGVLFGMNIMTFIFGSLGPESAGFAKTLNTTVNETNINPNGGYYVLAANRTNNPTAYTLISAFNRSTAGNYNQSIGLGNLSLNSTSGLLTNLTANWSNISITYSTLQDEGARSSAIVVQNESLYSIQVYAQASDTQFSVISIAIILVILISLFLLFWTYFMSGKPSGGDRGGSFS